MKNKLQLIDVSIVSGYMGRFQTTIVALLVLAITVHALITRKSVRGHITMTVMVPESGSDEGFYESFARLVSRWTSRSVVLASGDWDQPAELYLMPAVEFMERREALKLRALFGTGVSAHDGAVIVARAPVESAPAAAAEVLFESPRSLNGCWVQLRALAQDRVPVPRAADSLRFHSAGGGDRVVLDVLSDAAAYGACRSSDLARLRQRGVVGPGDLEVVLEVPALPELIFASREDDASYLVDRLGGLGAVFEDPSASPRDRDVVELLKERGVGSVRPVTGSQLAELEAVFEFMCARERRGEPTR